MPLPTESRAAWPPKEWAPVQGDIEEAAAWYAGDTAALAALYSGTTGTPPPSERARMPRLKAARFWGRRINDEERSRQRIHVPAAADIAATAADLLFGEPPQLLIPEAHGESADPEAKATQERINELIELDGIASTLLEAAEIAGGLGGIYLRPVWDRQVADHPMLSTVHPDRAVPTFQYGHLTGVTFWRVVLTDDKGQVWRHLERHERGVILHGLYAGTGEALGVRMPLNSLEATRTLIGPDGANEEGVVTLPDPMKGTIAARYVPNVLPNRTHRGRPVGRSDTDGTEDLMDALDETMTSWLRDIRLGKGRIVVPAEFLEHRGRGQGATFDTDQEVFAPLDIDPSNMERAGITISQFEIRSEQHHSTAMALFERIVATAGYSPQTFGIDGGAGEATATEIRSREARSLRTTNRKARYWKPAIEDVAEQLLIIDQAVFSGKVPPMRPRFALGDVIGQDVRDVASTLNYINLAQAASIETKVRMLNPEYDAEEVQAEVARIKEETGAAVPDPTGGLP